MGTGTARAFDVVETSGSSRAEVLAELTSRIRGMQRRTLGTGLEAPVVPVVDALAPLFPGAGLRPGAVYAVSSAALALMLMSESSRRGDWVAVVGIPDFSADAAEAAGIRLDRLILVPHPGRQLIRAAAALADVMSLVLVGSPGSLAPAEGARLEARLRRTGSILLSLGEWPGSEDQLALSDRQWSGLGSGHGHLAGCIATVTAKGRGGRPRQVRIALPGMSEAPDQIEHITE
ncbi:hypothetical protein [Paramicrobacterium humi]|nr:hypothetical protein [Microbacterium humi]